MNHTIIHTCIHTSYKVVLHLSPVMTCVRVSIPRENVSKLARGFSSFSSNTVMPTIVKAAIVTTMKMMRLITCLCVRLCKYVCMYASRLVTENDHSDHDENDEIDDLVSVCVYACMCACMLRISSRNMTIVTTMKMMTLTTEFLYVYYVCMHVCIEYCHAHNRERSRNHCSHHGHNDHVYPARMYMYVCMHVCYMQP